MHIISLTYKTTIDEVEKHIKEHINFLEKLEPYYLDDKIRLLVHAGFSNLKGIEYEYFKPLFYWDRTLWEMVLALDENILFESDFYPSRLKLYKEISGFSSATKDAFCKSKISIFSKISSLIFSIVLFFKDQNFE